MDTLLVGPKLNYGLIGYSYYHGQNFAFWIRHWITVQDCGVSNKGGLTFDFAWLSTDHHPDEHWMLLDPVSFANNIQFVAISFLHKKYVCTSC